MEPKDVLRDQDLAKAFLDDNPAIVEAIKAHIYDLHGIGETDEEAGQAKAANEGAPPVAEA